jgi:formylglycine-generating enzyme required for sulfatase activity
MKKYYWFLFLLPLFIFALASALAAPDGGNNQTGAALDLPMVRVPGAARFPTGMDDKGSCATVNYPYYMVKTEVTYWQWKTVYDWAVEHGYRFANLGGRGGYRASGCYDVYISGHEDHPVTCVSWRDCMVWCNALTEYSNAVEGVDYSGAMA